MRWRNILLIFRREVLDQLRDRRTLFMVAVLPLLLYPAMGIGMVQMTVLFSEQARTVVILGSESLPPLPLVEGERFHTKWFATEAEASKLRVITDGPVPEGLSKEDLARRSELLERARVLRQAVHRLKELELELRALNSKNDASEAIRLEKARLEKAVSKAAKPLGNAFSATGIQVLVVIPAEFAADLDRLRNELARHGRTNEPIGVLTHHRPVIVRNSADEKSMIAHQRVDAVVDEWERELLKGFLREGGLPENLTEPVKPVHIDVAVEEQVSASVWSKLFPTLLVIMALTGAFYPAIDLGAGEKERGTMETLLICPATRAEIVLGKFLTVFVFSASTALLNLASLGLTGKYMASLAGGMSGAAASRMSDLALPPFSSMIWVLVMLVPLATLFSALCLAFATFARSSKEGQYYLTPLLMVTLGLTVFCGSPGVEMEPFYSVMPVVGPALLLKGLLKATGPAAELYVYALPVLATSIGYSLLALWWAIEQFGSEEVLFREAERFDLKLWFRHLLRDKEPTPTFSEAGFCLLTIVMLQFLSWKPMQSAMQRASDDSRGILQMQLLIIQQIALIATPALFMGLLLTSSARKTFSLRWPGFGRLLQAFLLPFALHPLSAELIANLQGWFFPKLPPHVLESLKAMNSDAVPLWLVILAVALAPAVCEELAFRGFVLSGFLRSRKVPLAVALSSLAFGIVHMIPQQVFNASLLGLVLGAICVRSRSLWPGIVFHFVFNTLAILHGRFGEHVPSEGGAWGLFFSHDAGGSLRYQTACLLVSSFFAIGLLHGLTRHPTIQEDYDQVPEPPLVPADPTVAPVSGNPSSLSNSTSP